MVYKQMIEAGMAYLIILFAAFIAAIYFAKERTIKARINHSGIKAYIFIYRKLRWKKLILSAFIIQMVCRILVANRMIIVNTYAFIIQLFSYSLLITAFFRNSKYKGFLLMGVAGALNAIVILVNGGKMPVDVTLLQENRIEFLLMGLDFNHVTLTETTKLPFLADIIHPPGILAYGMQIVSIGDIIMIPALFLLVLNMFTLNGFRR